MATSEKKKKGEKKTSLEMMALKKSLIAIILIVILIFALRAGYHFMIGWDSKLHRGFKKMQKGSMISLVEDAMGNPLRRSDYHLEDFPALNYDELVRESKSSMAVKFYYYENGINTLYILGFNNRGVLTFKAEVEM